MILSEKIAETIYKKLSKLENRNGWVVHSSSFLPANVLCDYAGQRGLINLLRAAIQEELSRDPFLIKAQEFLQDEQFDEQVFDW